MAGLGSAKSTGGHVRSFSWRPRSRGLHPRGNVEPARPPLPAHRCRTPLPHPAFSLALPKRCRSAHPGKSPRGGPRADPAIETASSRVTRLAHSSLEIWARSSSPQRWGLSASTSTGPAGRCGRPRHLSSSRSSRPGRSCCCRRTRSVLGTNSTNTPATPAARRAIWNHEPRDWDSPSVEEVRRAIAGWTTPPRLRSTAFT